MHLNRNTPYLEHAYGQLLAYSAHLRQNVVTGCKKDSGTARYGRAISQYKEPLNAAISALTATCVVAIRLHDKRIGCRQNVYMCRMRIRDESNIRHVAKDTGNDATNALIKRTQEMPQLRVRKWHQRAALKKIIR